MARPNPIRAIMESELPTKTYQRQKLFRPRPSEVVYAYNIINRHIFDSQLNRPDIYVKSHLRKIWGCCSWLDRKQYTGSYCYIQLSDKWFCPQWFYQVLAHEMVHQWQWDVYRWDHENYFDRKMYEKSGAHGPSFYAWRDRFAEYGLNLKTSHGQKRWFKYQDFAKC
jgi:hypothetical protein